MSSAPSEIEQLIASLAPETRRQRQAALLLPLNTSLIIVSIVGLLVMTLTTRNPIGYAVVGSSLALNLLVALLLRTGRVGLAAQIFSVGANLGLLLLFGLNLFFAGDVTVGVIFACVLAMSVMLAGMLLGVPYAFLLAGINAAAVLLLLWRHFLLAGTGSTASALGRTISLSVPIIAFLTLIAIITWLYQRSLDLSEARLDRARRRIVQDELLRRDLAIARELQQRLYPPPPLTNPGLQIVSRSEPARETSGDFYDYIELDAEHLGIVVADVTGKSIAAALMMALARGTLRTAARRYSSPAEALCHANEVLARDHTARQLITAFYGILNTRTLALRFANAGHPYPVLRRGHHLEEIELSGLPLGARPDVFYQEVEVQLLPGDQLYILSDGLVEERNQRRELFGYERLNVVIRGADTTDPARALDELWRAVSNFRGATEQDDDITLVVIQVSRNDT